jgi:hypothetical protein
MPLAPSSPCLTLRSTPRLVTEGNEGNEERAGLALLVFKQVENIGAYLRRLGIPTFFPVSVNLPTNAGEPMLVRGTPLANLGMRFAKALVGAEVCGRHHSAGGQL